MSVPKRDAVITATARKIVENTRPLEDKKKRQETSKNTGGLRSLHAWLRKLDWSDRER